MAKKRTTKKSAAKKTTKKPAAKAAPKTASGRRRVLKKKPTAAKKATPAKPSGGKAKADGGKGKKLSAIDAAAQVLAKAREPMTSKQLIEAMAEQKLWTSPGGKTPHATLYSAILREIQKKGKDARFQKAERGKFAANG